MATKQNPGEFDCYKKAIPNEPLFVLLARDPSMPDLVRRWAIIRKNEIDSGRRPESDRAMVMEALDCANDADKWRAINDGMWRKYRHQPEIDNRQLLFKFMKAILDSIREHAPPDQEIKMDIIVPADRFDFNEWEELNKIFKEAMK
jgi:hypothetical protein